MCLSCLLYARTFVVGCTEFDWVVGWVGLWVQSFHFAMGWVGLKNLDPRTTVLYGPIFRGRKLRLDTDLEATISASSPKFQSRGFGLSYNITPCQQSSW